MAVSLQQPTQTAFDRDISRFTWLLLRFMFVMVPLVFVINGLTKGRGDRRSSSRLPWPSASRRNAADDRDRVPVEGRGRDEQEESDREAPQRDPEPRRDGRPVRRQDRHVDAGPVVLERYCDVALGESDNVLELAYLNSYFQTGLKNVLDRAVLAHEETHARARIPELAKVDEIPFDFERRIMSVVVRTRGGKRPHHLEGRSRGDLPRCAASVLDGKRVPMDHPHIVELTREHERLSADGFRVLAIATKESRRVPPTRA